VQVITRRAGNALLWPDGVWGCCGASGGQQSAVAWASGRYALAGAGERRAASGERREWLVLVSARAMSSLIVTSLVRFPKVKLAVFWQSPESFFRRWSPRRRLCGLFSGGPQKSREGKRPARSDQIALGGETYDRQRRTPDGRRGTFLAWTQKKSFFSAPKKPKKSCLPGRGQPV
jgi:hypothetical protein